MEPKITGKRIKMCDRKNITPFIDYSDSETYDAGTFINGDFHQIFTNYFTAKSVHFERGFIYNMEDKNLGLPDDIWRIIISIKWRKFYKHPNPYNMKMVKEFYTDLVDTLSKRLEVLEKGIKVQYSEQTTNMMLGVKNVGDTYQSLLENIDE